MNSILTSVWYDWCTFGLINKILHKKIHAKAVLKYGKHLLWVPINNAFLEAILELNKDNNLVIDAHLEKRKSLS